MMTMMLSVVSLMVWSACFWMLVFDRFESDLAVDGMTMTMQPEEGTVMTFETVNLPTTWKTVGQN